VKPNREKFGPLLHGTARAWRLKLDERLRPMGLSQAKWRTLMYLSAVPGALTQAEIAAHLGIEEPTLVALLHRLESAGWITRRSSSRDRRCNIVDLGRRAQRVIAKIKATAAELRRELLTDISDSELQNCMDVLERIHQRAEKLLPVEHRAAPARSRNVGNGTAGGKRANGLARVSGNGQRKNGQR
jgi:MarR family transcriptional regulator for hemolysin